MVRCSALGSATENEKGFVTDPYRPPVRAMLLNDTPLVIDGDDKLPPGNEAPNCYQKLL